MKNLFLFCLLLVFCGHLGAQCSPDYLPPVLVAKSNIQVALGGPKCTATVKPADLLQSVADNCAPGSGLKLRVRRAGPGLNFPPAGFETSLSLTTADLSKPVVAQVWALDTSGNAAFTYAGIDVTNPAGCIFQLLPDTIQVRMESMVGLEDVQWQIDGNVPPPPGSFTATDDHLYLAPDLFSGQYADNVYTIQPVKDNNPLNGVTTFDLVLLVRHVLNTESLNSPYKHFAADADRNGQITMRDLVELRKLILGIYTEMPENTSWRFIPSDYVFSSANPLGDNLPGSVTFNRNRETPLPDFVPIKVGDLNGSALINSLTPTEDRAAVALRIQDTRVSVGETVLIPVSLDAGVEMTGLQMAFSFDPAALQLLDIEPGNLPDFTGANYFQPEPGVLTVSWITPNLEPVFSEKPLFYLRFSVLKPALLSEVLSFQPRRLRPEIYDAANRTGGLNLEFLPLPAPVQTRIYAPTPNPVAGDVAIRMELAEAGAVTIELLALDGQLMYSSTEQLVAGVHTLTVPKTAFGDTTGMFFYRVTAGTAQAQGRVVALR